MLTQRPAAPYLINHAPGRGAIARFNTDTAQILSVLDSLAKDTDGISLSPWMWAGIGPNDQYLDWDSETGELMVRGEQNFIDLLDAIAARFRWVQVAPQFYDPDTTRTARTGNQSWPRNVGMDAFVPTALFMDWLTSALDASGLEWMVDLVPGFNDVYPTNPGFQQYVKDMWARMTLLRSPGGVPCWNYSMSFIMANWDGLQSAFQGNVPGILLPHTYSGDLLAIDSQLIDVGLYSVPWIVGEDFTLQDGDTATVQKWASFVQQSKQRIIRVCPWPILTTWKEGDGILAPPLSPKVWNSI